MSHRTPLDRHRAIEHPYATPGGFYIGDDVEVALPDGRVEAGRVQGSDGPFVRVMLESGHGYIAAEDMLTRAEACPHDEMRTT